jgi:uridine kinase
VDLDDLAGRIHALDGRPRVVAVSGFAGSGKSTVTQQLLPRIMPAAIVETDHFHTNRALGRSSDWGTIDRRRLIEQVLTPFKASGRARYQVYDWPLDRPDKWVAIADADFLVVEGVGLIHPDLTSFLDYIVWVDCPLDVATQRAIDRNREQGERDEELWWDMWNPNDRDYFERFQPRALADYVIPNQGPPPGTMSA